MTTKTRSPHLLPIILGTIITIGILWLYYYPLSLVAEQVAESEDYSFGLLLPLVAAYITYLKWPEIRRTPRRPSWIGLAVMALGFALYVVGDFLAIIYLPSVSFIVVIAGIICLLTGRRILRLLWFPLFLLFLMVPLPAVLMKSLTLKLQLLSSLLASDLLQAAGILVVRHGNVIDLGVRQLQVVEACSGLRYLLSLFALGIIYCYFFQRRYWKATILLLSLIPASIMANAFRVAAMAIFPVLSVEGFWHSFSGWLIFIFAFGLLALTNWLLNYLSPGSPGTKPPDAPTVTPLAAPRKASYNLPLLAALALLLLAMLGTTGYKAAAVPLRQSLDKFPLQLGSWQGQRRYLDPAMAKRVGATDYLEAIFHNPDRSEVSLWIGYFGTQSQKISERIHSPLICLTGSGWKIVESRIVDIAPGRPVRYLLIEQAGTQQVVYYWYLQGGRWLASEYPTRLYMGFDALVRRRNDGAIVRLITPAGNSVKSARNRLDGFGRLLVPMLPQFFQQ
jgi:exosortase D (VPLPA-CTERM-specific)